MNQRALENYNRVQWYFLELQNDIYFKTFFQYQLIEVVGLWFMY